MARGNGEGSIYDTVQKVKKDFDNTKMCSICSNCQDRSLCNDRKGWEKCDRCAKCTGSKSCDRFYIYKRTFAQIYTIEGKKTVASAKTKKEANIKKEEKEKEIKRQQRIHLGDLTLKEVMEEVEKIKLENKQIKENTYVRNLETIKKITSHYVANLKIKDITLDDMRSLFLYFVNSDSSQSELDKIYDEVHAAFTLCKLDTMDEIKRNTYISHRPKKDVIAFTVEEEKKLLNYINDHSNKLITSSRCKLDYTTMKNIIKIALATGMRIGEICSLNKDKNIDMDRKDFTVKTTLTRNLKGKTIIGTGTKNELKKKKVGKTDERHIPFGVLFDEQQILNIINEQYKIASNIPNNTNNLLFCTIEGELISHTSVGTIFKKICSSARY